VEICGSAFPDGPGRDRGWSELLAARSISLALTHAFSMGFKVRRIGRQIEQPAPLAWDAFTYSLNLVTAQIVITTTFARRKQHDRAPWFENRPEDIRCRWRLAKWS